MHDLERSFAQKPNKVSCFVVSERNGLLIVGGLQRNARFASPIRPEAELQGQGVSQPMASNDDSHEAQCRGDLMPSRAVGLACLDLADNVANQHDGLVEHGNPAVHKGRLNAMDEFSPSGRSSA